jgi:hypothetical protein
MNGWTKYFTDGTKEEGSDEDVRDRKASWSKGRLQDICCLETWHQDVGLSIKGTGSFWQSDDWEVIFLQSTPSIILRRIEKQIHETDKCIIIEKSNSPLRVSVEFKDSFEAGGIPLEDKQGQWFVIELDLEQKAIRTYFTEEKI